MIYEVFDIPEYIVEEAKQLSMQKVGSDKYARFISETSGNRWEISFIGEFMVEKYCKEHNIDYEYFPWVWDSKDMGYDIVINGKKVDIKTCRREYPISNLSSNFRFQVAEYSIKPIVDCFMSVLLHKDKAYFMGVVEKEVIKRLSTSKSCKTPSKEILFSKLMPMSKWCDVDVWDI